VKTLNPPRSFRRLIAVAAAAAFGLTLAPAAQAADDLVDPTLKGSITITKQLIPAANTQDTGAVNPSATNPPVSGVTFTAHLVSSYNGQTIDLTTADGWAAAAAMSAAMATDGSGSLPTGTVLSQTTAVPIGPTNASGVATVSNLPLGLYWIEETTAPGDIVPVVPFLVTLPMTNPQGNGWMYDVYVYPKNQHVNLKKTVNDASATTAGQPLSYTIVGDIPSVVSEIGGTPQVAPISAYILSDQVDSRLTVANASAVAVTLTTPSGSGQQLVSGDYNTTVSSSGLVTVTFSAQGLLKLQSAAEADYAAGRTGAAAQQVQAVISTTVNTTLNTQNTAANGIIANTAQLFPDSQSVTSQTAVKSNTTQSYYGGVMLHKETTDGTALSGATVQVYASLAAAQAGTAPLSAQKLDGTQATSFTTGTDGQVAILGLHYSPDPTAPNTCQHSGMTGTQYWLVETQAPTGYELQTTPTEICLVGVLDHDAAGASYDDWTMTNVKHNAGFDMPFTGPVGRTMLPIVGLAVVGGATAVLVIRNRRSALATA